MLYHGLCVGHRLSPSKKHGSGLWRVGIGNLPAWQGFVVCSDRLDSPQFSTASPTP